ncbi:hypothetical protein [Cupriavidus sp. H18C1]|uniref:hypothetical protein n=1 Tax=Cupriavidus sp. H18C1 TaxID=3241601 RepID=UPI003BB8BAA8
MPGCPALAEELALPLPGVEVPCPACPACPACPSALVATEPALAALCSAAASRPACSEVMRLTSGITRLVDTTRLPLI